MPKLAQYDPTHPVPQPVIGWYDTDTFDYTNLPPPEQLIELTEAEWEDRLTTPFIADGKLITTPAKSDAQMLAEVIFAQLNTLAESYNAAIQLPVSYLGSTFQADEPSQLVLTKCLVAGSVPAGFYWLDANNHQVVMTFAQLQGLSTVMLVQGQAAFAKLQTLKAQVRAATTLSAVQAVVW